jgi:hypothetical protein
MRGLKDVAYPVIAYKNSYEKAPNHKDFEAMRERIIQQTPSQGKR